MPKTLNKQASCKYFWVSCIGWSWGMGMWKIWGAFPSCKSHRIIIEVKITWRFPSGLTVGCPCSPCWRCPPLRVQMSNTFYESSDQWWFSMESVSLLYNKSEEAAFNASEVYAPASSSYHCLHVSSLQHYSTLLLPSNEQARRWSITFTNFHVRRSSLQCSSVAQLSSLSMSKTQG